MKESLQRIVNTKQFNIIMIAMIITIILFVVGIISLKYHEEGEVNLPFKLSKIVIISDVEGTDNKTENKWDINVNQNNDIYIYIEKNNDYKYTEAIENIKLDNFNIEQKLDIGQKKLYKPEVDVESKLFKNVEENEVKDIIYQGSLNSDIKNLKISNQGGLVVFRYSTMNIGNYVSNEDEQIDHVDLLKNININNDDLKFKLNFDVSIILKSTKKYIANISLDLPINNIVEEGVQSLEITDLNNVVFKRFNQ